MDIDASDLVFINTELDLLCERYDYSEHTDILILNREIIDSPFVKSRMKHYWIYNFINSWKPQGPFRFEFRNILISLLFAIVVAFVPSIRSLFYSHEYMEKLPPLYSITETIRTLGNLAAPYGLIVIGAKVFQCFKEIHESDSDNQIIPTREYDKVTTKVVILNIIVKMIVLPFFSLFVIMIFDSLNHLIDDPLISVIVLIMTISPSTLSFLVDDDHKKSSCIRILNSLVMIQHLCCLATIVTMLSVTLCFVDL